MDASEGCRKKGTVEETRTPRKSLVIFVQDANNVTGEMYLDERCNEGCIHPFEGVLVSQRPVVLQHNLLTVISGY